MCVCVSVCTDEGVAKVLLLTACMQESSYTLNLIFSSSGSYKECHILLSGFLSPVQFAFQWRTNAQK